MIRSLGRACAVRAPFGLALLAGALTLAMAAGPAANVPQDPQPQQRPPVFRAGATFVTVDAYPRRDNRIVEGLSKADFEILEDGKPQAVESFEFVRVPLNVPDAERRDPNTKEEGDRWAADAKNRVFVIYLDTLHVTAFGSLETRRPLMTFLQRSIGPADVFGVMTPETPISQLLFGRRLETIESELTRYANWGQKELGGSVIPRDATEQRIAQCFNPPDGVIRLHRMDKLFTSLENLTVRLGGLRDERKHVLLVTQGWVPRAEATALLNAVGGGVPQVGLGPTGRLGIGGRTDGGMDRGVCDAIATHLAGVQFDRRFRDLLTLAQRANVSFHPIDVAGLSTDPGQSGRVQTLMTLAENTDGHAIVNTNDITAGITRIADDLAAYYLLGYYSTNTKLDGRYRRIEVKVTQPRVRVTARQGYLAPTEANLRASEAAATAKPAGPSPAEEALGVLARLRASAEMHTYGTASDDAVTIVAEIVSREIELGRWKAGGAVAVTLTGADGKTVDAPPVPIAPGARSAAVRVPIADAGTGPWTAAVRVSGDGSLSDRIEIAPAASGLIGEALAFRATPSPRSPLRPMADFLFRRTERVHVEWPVRGTLDQRAVRLLDRRGQALPMPVAAIDAGTPERPLLVVDLNLAGLTEGDYVIEVRAGRGTESTTRYLPFRVVR
jgi:VWFA-related protein